MKRAISWILVTLLLSAFVGACGGGGGAAAPPPPPPPPPPPAGDQSPTGLWTGTAMTPDIPDIVTGFEFNDAEKKVAGARPDERS